MKLNPAEVLNPIFKTLDALIQNYGVYLYLVFVWLSLAVIAWVLSGGLRRKRPQGNSATIIPGIIFSLRPPIQPPPPIIWKAASGANGGSVPAPRPPSIFRPQRKAR